MQVSHVLAGVIRHLAIAPFVVQASAADDRIARNVSLDASWLQLTWLALGVEILHQQLAAHRPHQVHRQGVPLPVPDPLQQFHQILQGS